MLQAFKTYGLMLADNGSAWYVSGAPGCPLERRGPAHAEPGPRVGLRGRRYDGVRERV